MNLLVDTGNTCIKWSISRGNELGKPVSRRYEQAKLGELLELEWTVLERPDAVLVANVAGGGTEKAIIAVAEKLWSLSPVFARVDKQAHGLVNGYKDISQLGVDRWLAMLAVWSHYRKAACIVDCGTALTIDVINSQGQHQGGLIIPGPELMQRSLISETSDISALISHDFSQELGLATEECIRNGAGLAGIAFVDRVVLDLKQKYGTDLCCVMTGGGAENIKSVLSTSFEYDINLVFRGLLLSYGETA